MTVLAVPHTSTAWAVLQMTTAPVLKHTEMNHPMKTVREHHLPVVAVVLPWEEAQAAGPSNQNYSRDCSPGLPAPEEVGYRWKEPTEHDQN